MFDPRVKRQLHLTQDWDSAWESVFKPWLGQVDTLRRGVVVVPTRGQARALRLRMATEGVLSVGTRFLTPGLIRRMPFAQQAQRATEPGRSVIEFGLKAALERALGGAPGLEESGLARSVLSRPAAPIDDWQDLLRVGLDEDSFPHPFVTRTFRFLREWLGGHGFAIPCDAGDPDGGRDEPAVTSGPDRALIYGFSADHWRDWQDLARLIAAADEVTAILPFPSFEGKPLEERWVGLFEELMEVDSLSLPDQVERPQVELARSWALNLPAETVDPVVIDRTPVLVGTDTGAEVALLFNQIVKWLDFPEARIAVIFPAGMPAVADLASRLDSAGIRFCDEIATTGAPSGETGIIRALLVYQRSGCTLETFWELARRLRASGLFGLSAGESRGWIERVFDACQTHRVEDAVALPEAARIRGGALMVELAAKAGFWPENLTVARAVRLMEACVVEWGLDVPERLGGLDRLVADAGEAYPKEAVIDLLAGSLAERAPRQGLRRDDFAPVVLTTRRRATAQVWTHIAFAASNAEAWPAVPEETFWLSDPARRELNRRLNGSLQLPLSEDGAISERLGYLDLCSNVKEEVAFSASLQRHDGNEADCSPHPWLERLLLGKSRLEPDLPRDERLIGNGWRKGASRLGPGIDRPGPNLTSWLRIWNERRDPGLPFNPDFYCLAHAPGPGQRWAARLLERGFGDPVILWYEGLLRLQPVGQGGLERSRRKELGLVAHRFLAKALRGDHPVGTLVPASEPAHCRVRLDRMLAQWRKDRPANAYWDSFHLELTALTRALLERVVGLTKGATLGVEYALPPGTFLATNHGDIPVSGRLDLAILDRPEWAGADVLIVDFKTGGDQPLSAARMASVGRSLQLGVYLQAAMAMGANQASVRMVQSEGESDSELTNDLLDQVQPAFDRLGSMILTGRFGQLTADRSRYQRGFEMPLASVPIAHSVLEQKYRLTFPAGSETSPLRGGGDGAPD